jgi:hypothetical protein
VKLVERRTWFSAPKTSHYLGDSEWRNQLLYNFNKEALNDYTRFYVLPAQNMYAKERNKCRIQYTRQSGCQEMRRTADDINPFHQSSLSTCDKLLGALV